MIGQQELRSTYKKLATTNSFPHFIILYGEKYSGRKTLAQEFSVYLDAKFIPISPTVDDIRKCTEYIENIQGNVVFVIADADNAKISSLSALLKLTEDCPANVYYVLTVQSVFNVPDTLISRAVVENMRSYTKDELLCLFRPNEHNLPTTKEIIQCSGNVGLVKYFQENGTDLLVFCKKIVEHITTVSGANSLKLVTMFSSKQNQNKYDPILCLHVISNLCKMHLLEECKWATFGVLTNLAERKLGKNNIPAVQVLDEWVLSLRRLLH